MSWSSFAPSLHFVCLQRISPLTLMVYICSILAVYGQGRDNQVLLGAGCDISNYADLETSQTDVKDAQLAYSTTEGTENGFGMYVLHFQHFQLPLDDFLMIKGLSSDMEQMPVDSSTQSPDHVVPVATLILTGRNASGTFHSTPIKGKGFTVELYKSTKQTLPFLISMTSRPDLTTSADCMGFQVDSYRFVDLEETTKLKAIQTDLEELTESYRQMNMTNSTRSEADESICGVDESQDAACCGLKNGMASIITYSQPVARLLIVKNSGFNIAYCTGFLLGCEGHLLTNQHCIRNWLDAINTQVEVLAQAPSCPGGSDSTLETCTAQSSCPGQMLSTTTRLVAVSEKLDYALVSLTGTSGSSGAAISAIIGYLRLRSTGPILNEEVFIPQYPLGHGKRIATLANGLPAKIDAMNGVEACEETDVGYYADTQDGSSGSPVIALSDYLVIALHHCGGCLNGGIPVQLLLRDMILKNVLPKCSVV